MRRWRERVDVWVHEEDGEWVAWANPFSEFGTGESSEEAVLAAQKSVEDFLVLASEEMRACDKLRVHAPLSNEEMVGERHGFDLDAVVSGEGAITAMWTPVQLGGDRAERARREGEEAT